MAARGGDAWLLVNLPVMLLFPRGWSEFFGSTPRRGDVWTRCTTSSWAFTGWRGFGGFWEPPLVLFTFVTLLFVLCCAAI